MRNVHEYTPATATLTERLTPASARWPVVFSQARLPCFSGDAPSARLCSPRPKQTPRRWSFSTRPGAPWCVQRLPSRRGTSLACFPDPCPRLLLLLHLLLLPQTSPGATHPDDYDKGQLPVVMLSVAAADVLLVRRARRWCLCASHDRTASSYAPARPSAAPVFQRLPGCGRRAASHVGARAGPSGRQQRSLLAPGHLCAHLRQHLEHR